MKALQQWFDVQNDYFQPHAEEIVLPLDTKRLSSKHCISGHFGHKGYEIQTRYPQVFNSILAKHRFRCFTFIREPLAMRCSLYRHKIQHSSKSNELSLEEHLNQKNNYTARIIGAYTRNYRDILDQYFYVGTADNLQHSFDILAKKINKQPLELENFNTTKKHKVDVVDALSEAQIREFKQQNVLDYLIYDYARARQEADRIKLGL